MKLGKKTKVLALVISALMIISVFPFTASADDPALTLGACTIARADGVATITVPFTSTGVAQVTVLAVRSKVATGFPTFGDDAALVAETKFIDQKAAASDGSGTFTIKVNVADFTDTNGKYLALKIGGTLIGTAKEGNPFEIPGGDVTFIIGDVDDNGSIGSNDASVILRKVVDSSVVFASVSNGKAPNEIAVGDVDNSGSIGSNDASYILRKVVDSLVVFPRQ